MFGASRSCPAERGVVAAGGDGWRTGSARTIALDVASDVLDARRIAQEKRDRPYTPLDRERSVSAALRAYASMATSASDGAYRRVPE